MKNLSDFEFFALAKKAFDSLASIESKLDRMEQRLQGSEQKAA